MKLCQSVGQSSHHTCLYISRSACFQLDPSGCRRIVVAIVAVVFCLRGPGPRSALGAPRSAGPPGVLAVSEVPIGVPGGVFAGLPH